MGPNLYWWLGFEQAWFIVFYVCDTSGLLSSQPDATQVPQWLNPNSDGWPHDHLMTLPRAPAGTSGFGILSNAVIYTPLRQVRAFRLPFGMVCFCSWAPPHPPLWVTQILRRRIVNFKVFRTCATVMEIHTVSYCISLNSVHGAPLNIAPSLGMFCTPKIMC